MKRFTIHYYDGNGNPQIEEVIAWDIYEALKIIGLRMWQVTFYDISEN